MGWLLHHELRISLPVPSDSQHRFLYYIEHQQYHYLQVRQQLWLQGTSHSILTTGTLGKIHRVILMMDQGGAGKSDL